MNSSSENKNRSKGRNRRLWKRLLFAVSRKHTREDFEIAIFLPHKTQNSAAAFLKIDQALNLISKCDPDRYHEVQSYIKRIWVYTTPTAGAQWESDLRMCILDRDYFFRTDVSASEIASIIVHEATHADLDNNGIECTDESRARIERICMEAELSFVKRLPDNEELIKNVENRLATPESFWTRDAHLERLLDEMDIMAKESKLMWLLNPLVKQYVKRKRPHR